MVKTNENNEMTFPGLKQALDQIYKEITQPGSNFNFSDFLENNPASQVVARGNFAVAFQTYQWGGGNYEYRQKKSAEWKQAFKTAYPNIDISSPENTSFLSENVNEEAQESLPENRSFSLDDTPSTTSEEISELDSGDDDLWVVGEDIFAPAANENI